MASSLLEQARALHADVEQQRGAIIEDMVHARVSTTRDDIAQNHRIRNAMDRIVSNSRLLEEYYEDRDGVGALELDALSGQGEERAVFSQFYEKLKDIREFHRVADPELIQSQAVDAVDTGAENSAAGSKRKFIKIDELVEFSGEEFSGKYLDLYPIYQTFLNCKSFKRKKYIRYLKTFYDFSKVQQKKKNREYMQYLTGLLKYLVSFFERTNPLYPTSMVMGTIEEHYAKAIKENGKEQLYCYVCERTFANKNVFEAHLKGKKHLKNLKKKAASQIENGKDINLNESSEMNFSNDCGLVEEKIRCFATLLKEKIISTIQFVESMQTKTYAEIRNERYNISDDEDEDEDSDDDGVIHNPKQIPLGWDGKPIPYWLYKLHGLNIEYKCEICGDYSYWGPRAFEQHFNEWRHVSCLRSLGIPNSKHFKNITRMEDAIALYHKLQELDKKRMWRPDQDEEFEDTDGNVFNKKTYDDLKRQGLL